jgi:hypothetical protein
MILKDKSDLAPNCDSVTVAGAVHLMSKHDTTAVLDSSQRADQGHQRRLATTRGPRKEHYFPRLKRQIQVDQDRSLERPPSKGVCEFPNFNSGAHMD